MYQPQHFLDSLKIWERGLHVVSELAIDWKQKKGSQQMLQETHDDTVRSQLKCLLFSLCFQATVALNKTRGASAVDQKKSS